MAQWKKLDFGKYEIDVEVLEEALEELLFEALSSEEIDLSRPLQLGITVFLDESGKVKVNDLSLLKEPEKQGRGDDPLIELIDAGKEFIVVVETAKMPEKNLDIKVLDKSVIVSGLSSKDFSKKIIFPEKVEQKSVKTFYNNGILEIRLLKKFLPQNKITSSSQPE
ncbi:MAG TPA: Hsp20 family protein [archaeon]|nr:Hsp20 family protein [archaeon]